MPPQGHDRRFARRSRTAGGSPREGRRGRSPRPPPAVCALLAAAAAEGGTARQAPLFRAHRPVPTRRDRDTLGALDHALMRHTTAHTPRPRHSGHRSATGAQSAPERQQTAGPSRGRGTPPVTRTQHHRLSTTDSARSDSAYRDSTRRLELGTPTRRAYRRARRTDTAHQRDSERTRRTPGDTRHRPGSANPPSGASRVGHRPQTAKAHTRHRGTGQGRQASHSVPSRVGHRPSPAERSSPGSSLRAALGASSRCARRAVHPDR